VRDAIASFGNSISTTTISCLQRAYAFSRVPKLLVARQWSDDYNRQVYPSVDPRQETNELLEAESLELPVIDVRHPRFVNPKHACGNPRVLSTNFREDRPPDLLLEAWNRVIDHS